MINPSSSHSRQVEVLLPKPFDHGFDYTVPECMSVQPGDYVRVPFGRQTLVGVVWGEGRQDVSLDKIKSIEEVISHIPSMQEAMRRTIDWVSRYTLSPKGMVLKMALPVAEALELPKKRERQTVEATAALIPKAPQLSPEQQIASAELAAKLDAGFSVTVLDGVTGSGKTEVYFDTIAHVLQDARHCEERSNAAIQFDGKAGSPRFARDDGQVLVLLPEIALSVQWVERCRERFGVEPHIWHSGLTPAKRRDTWRAVADGSARLVVGARSALFLPYHNLRLIVVDEEHEQSYKQEDGVLYQARDMAVARAHLEKIPVLLVSATPSLETVYNIQQGRYGVVKLPQRHGGVQMPAVKLVDMRAEMLDSGTWLSPALRSSMGETLANGRQSMLFLNRRGYAPLLLCRCCGYRFACEECSGWMVVHGKKSSESRVQSSVSSVIPAQAGIHIPETVVMDSRLRGNDDRKKKGHSYSGKLQCHHCGHVDPIPQQCPGCSEVDSLVACGPGVERVAEEVREVFPQARVAVMTSDTMGGLASAEDIVQAMTRGEIDILVGTQMMAKGYHFPLLHLIGVVDADLGLQGGDMRAGERTYQLLHQVAGRAGREREQGKVLLQTYLPDHPVMKALAAHDREALERLELAAREDAVLPPYGRLAAIIVEAEKEADALQASRALASRIPKGEIRVLGPAPAPLSRLRGRYRYRFLIRAGRNIQLQPFLSRWVGQFDFPSRIRVRVDIDPYSFL